MQCIRPLPAGFDLAGNITYTQRNWDKSQPAFAFECRKCLPCRLNNAREKAIRAWHQSKITPGIFLTLTYDDDHLESPRLIYAHWQGFIRALREKIGHEPDKRIKTMVTGEYGEQLKRPHWHALIFNWRPTDEIYRRTTERGDRVYTSETLSNVWGRGLAEYGELTLDSANYTCRYAAKKLVHGKDQDHDYHPIHKTSSRRAIGRDWIEKYWKHTFQNGFVVLPNGSKAKIPRYYVDWLKKHHFDEYLKYLIDVQPKIQTLALEQQKEDEKIYLKNRDESRSRKNAIRLNKQYLNKNLNDYRRI